MTLVATSAKASGSSGGVTQLFDSQIGANAASIDTGANGIASGSHALIVMIRARSVKAAVATDKLIVTVNGDTGANYNFNLMNNHAGLTSGSESAAATTPAAVLECTAATAPANAWGNHFLTCLGYTDAFWKSLNYMGSYLASTSNNQSDNGFIQWQSAASINQIKIAFAADNLLAGSRLTILGL